MNKIIDNLIFASLSLVVAMLCAGWMILLAKLIVSGHFYWAIMLFFTTVFFISLLAEYENHD